MRVPKLRRHATGLATVRLSGKDHYCPGVKWAAGESVPPAAQAWYDRKLAEWLAGGRQPLTVGSDLTVGGLVDRYRLHVERTYTKLRGGELRPTSEITVVRSALKLLLQSHGQTSARDFGPLALKAYRSHLERHRSVKGRNKGRPLSRQTVNSYVFRVKSMFKWAVSEQMLPGYSLADLYAVQAMREGRTSAPDRARIAAPPIADVETVLAQVEPALAALARVQMQSGMRPGEAVHLRPRNIDRTAEPWEYRPDPENVKVAGKARLVFFGPRSRPILTLLLAGLGPDDFVFRQARTGTPWSTKWYSTQILETCRAAGVTPWHPHQLRHYMATVVEAAHGLETAAHVIGDTVDVAKIYAHAGREKARRAVEELG